MCGGARFIEDVNVQYRSTGHLMKAFCDLLWETLSEHDCHWRSLSSYTMDFNAILPKHCKSVFKSYTASQIKPSGLSPKTLLTISNRLFWWIGWEGASSANGKRHHANSLIWSLERLLPKCSKKRHKKVSTAHRLAECLHIVHMHKVRVYAYHRYNLRPIAQTFSQGQRS